MSSDAFITVVAELRLLLVDLEPYGQCVRIMPCITSCNSNATSSPYINTVSDIRGHQYRS